MEQGGLGKGQRVCVSVQGIVQEVSHELWRVNGAVWIEKDSRGCEKMNEKFGVGRGEQGSVLELRGSGRV